MTYSAHTQNHIDTSKFPRIKPVDLDNAIERKTFYHHGLLTICVLNLTNGFTVTGESACAHEANYDKIVGEELAYKDAWNKLWLLLGYELKTKLDLALQHAEIELINGKVYVGTKVVHAEPLNRGDYNELRGWTVPDNENPDDEGYLVVYPDQQDNAPESGLKGYLSWSPKEVFEKHYEDMGIAHPNRRPEWLIRLEDEKRDLGNKLSKLRDYLGQQAIDLRDPLLVEQEQQMAAYYETLSRRLLNQTA